MKAGVMLLRSNNINFSVKNSTKDNEDHFTIIPGSTHQGDIIILNVYVSNNRISKYMKKTPELQRKRWIQNYSQRFQYPSLNN